MHNPAGLPILTLVGIAALATGCVGWPRGAVPQVPLCPGPIVPMGRVAEDFTARHNGRITAEGLDVALSVVVQKRGDRLMLVGFGLFGSKRFAVVQRGESVEIEYFGPPLEVPAENVLRDIHRLHFASILEPPSSGGSDATVESEVSAAGQRTTRIVNRACGYRATYVTASEAIRP